MPVQFAFSEPSEGEYFEKYNQYNGFTLWFALIFMLRGCAPYSLAVQTGFLEIPKGVDSFVEHLSPNVTSFLIYTSACTRREQNKSHPNEVECPKQNLMIEMSIFKNLGYGLGGIIGGVLSDLFGRRPVSFWFSVIWFIFSLILNFGIGRTAFSVIYVFTSAACSAVNVVTFVNFAEIAKKKNRILSIYTILSYAFGNAVVTYVTSKVHDWHNMMAFNTANIMVLIFACWYMPESPRWLLNKNKKKEAFAQLEEISGLVYDIEHITTPPDSEILSKKYEFIEIMKHIVKKKSKNFLLLIVLMIISVSFFSPGLWQRIFYSKHINEYVLLRSVVIASSYFFILPIYFLVGKRLELFIIYLLMAIVSVACLASEEKHKILYFSFFSIFLGFSALNLQWLYILYLFPTFIRNTTIGFYFFVFSLIDICGLIITDQNEKDLGDHHYVIFLIIACFGVVVLFLPDTSKNELPNYKINY